MFTSKEVDMMLKIVFLALRLAQRDAMVAEAAKKLPIDPQWAVAVARVENTTARPEAVNRFTGATGLMQVMPAWIGTFHHDCDVPVGPPTPLWYPPYNICLGVHILRHYWWRCNHNWSCTLKYYNGAQRVKPDSYIASVTLARGK